MRKILVMQTAFLGDAILATALLEKLREAFPQARIDFLLRKGFEGIMDGHPFVGRVLTLDKKRKFASVRELLREIRGERYELVVNAQRFASSGFLAAFSGAGSVVGFARNPFSRWFDRRVAHGLDQGHEVERNQRLIAHLTDERPAMPRLYPAGLPRVALGEAYICVAPSSVWFTKQWPAAQWADFVAQVPEGLRVLLLGGPGDQQLCQQIAERSGNPRCENLAGRLSLLESAAVMGGAAMNYANDSAPTHLASAVGASVCTVFCSTVPAFGFGPLGPGSAVVETQEALDCRPCGPHGHKACPRGHFRCATGIASSQLLEMLPKV